MRRLLFLIICLSTLTLSVTYGANPIKVACVGNSITYGAGVENREVNSYPAVLQVKLGDGYVVGNFGLSGATLLNKGHNPYTKTKQYADALAMNPDIVVIHLGINDTDPRNYPHFQEEFQSDYISLIESFRKVNPNVRVIIARMTPISSSHKRFKAGTRDWHSDIQREIERIAEVAKVELIDFHELLYTKQHLIPDGVHPNVEGAKLLADRVFKAIVNDLGGLQMGPLYGDNMVLQRSNATLISGNANKGELVTVIIKNGKESIQAIAMADNNGHWNTPLPLENYGTDFTLSINAKSGSKEYKNVAVGEVWMASGQSNMSFAVAGSSTPKDAKPSDMIRLFKVTPTFPIQDSLSIEELEKLNNLDYLITNGWQNATQKEVDQFSAVAYFFAQKLSRSMPGVPIGIIQTSLGGATAEGFVSRKLMENDNWMVDMISGWRSSPMIMQWCRDVANRSLKGTKNPLQRHYFQPSYLYESRILPMKNYSLAGVLWYQGESNAENIEIHEHLFPMVVETFRDTFRNPNLPFYFVQLSSMERPSWARMRESQRKLAKQIENCEMVVSSDLGDPKDVHPTNKKPIGERLAGIALAKNYNHKKVVYNSPEAVSLNGNTITFADVAGALKSSDRKEIRGFEVAGKDMIFHPVKVNVKGDMVTLSVEEAPLYVRYAWKPYTDANLVGGTGLPVSTFIIKQK